MVLLSLCPPVPGAARAEILLVEVDNPALEEMGPWPWTRDIFADALLSMKELGAATAVFDIEYFVFEGYCPQYLIYMREVGVCNEIGRAHV